MFKGIINFSLPLRLHLTLDDFIRRVNVVAGWFEGRSSDAKSLVINILAHGLAVAQAGVFLHKCMSCKYLCANRLQVLERFWRVGLAGLFSQFLVVIRDLFTHIPAAGVDHQKKFSGRFVVIQLNEMITATQRADLPVDDRVLDLVKAQ